MLDSYNEKGIKQKELVTMTYSIDFQKKVLAIREKEEMSFAAVTKRVGVRKKYGICMDKKIELQKKRNKPAIKIDMEKFKEEIK